MAGLEEKLCPVCFQEAMEHGECRNCGYHAEESSAVKDYLAPFTILKEKYLLGKSLGQGGFGITYLAENMQSGLRCCIKEYFPSGLLQGRTPDGALIWQMKKTGLSMKRESSSSLKKHAPFRSFEKISLSLTFWIFLKKTGRHILQWS